MTFGLPSALARRSPALPAQIETIRRRQRLQALGRDIQLMMGIAGSTHPIPATT